MTTTMRPFVPSRLTGKSDASIVCDMARDAEPGTVLTYERIGAALGADTERAITREVSSSAARAASKRLLREDQRCLIAVPKVGYRVSRGDDHHGVAMTRYHRADAQLKHGLSVLQYVRRDEMSQNQLLAHDGTLIVLSALCQMTQAAKRRQDKVESIIARIAGKIGIDLDTGED